MSKHASRPYNPNIAHVLYLVGFIESWGRGVEKIWSACKKNGMPQPEYIVTPGDIMIKFSAPDDWPFKVTDKVIDKVTDKVTDNKEKVILSLLMENPTYTTSQLAKLLSVSRKTVSLKLKKLKDAGLVVREGSDRKGSWSVVKEKAFRF